MSLNLNSNLIMISPQFDSNHFFAKSRPIQIGTLSSWTILATGGDYSLALKP